MNIIENSLHKHLNDPHRLAALRAVALLDTPAEEAFDRLTRLAARFTDAPVALVSLVDADRQFFKSCVGLPEPWSRQRETPLSHSFCQHNRVSGTPLIITDAREDPFFKNNLAVRDLSVIAYLGIPLVTSDSYVLGSFCVIDTKPHMWSEEDVGTVIDLASAVMTEIELRTEKVERRQVEGDRDELTALYASLQDESESRRRAEALLHEAVKSANVGLWDWDLINNAIHYSIEWKEQIGFGDHEINNDFKEWECRVHPDDLLPVLKIIQQCKDGLRKNYKAEFRFLHKNGSYLWILAQGSVILDETGRPAKIMGAHIDITDRKQMEEKLRDSEEKMQLFIEHAPAALAMFDREMRYIAVSRLWREDYGLGGRDVIGQSHYEIFPEIAEKWKTVHRRGLKGEVIEAESDSFKRLDGTIQWLRWLVRPWHKADGTVGGIVIFTEDLTEKKKVETEHKKLQDQLNQAQKMESVGRLAGGVAHDYNNMLSVIIGYAELALEKLVPGESLYSNIMEIYKAAKRSMIITRQLLTFARQQPVIPKVLDINETVDHSLKMLRQLIGENIELIWSPGAVVGQVRIDPGQVDQILANLCINSRDAIGDVGKITIETERASFDENYCREHAGMVPGDFVVLIVSDDGCGMNALVREKIFEPFFTTKKIGQGTGLGLATVYGIVKQNMGFVNVFSEPGKGTTFKTYLPVYEGQVVNDRGKDSEEFPRGQGEMVLVVEDETSILQLAKRVLSGLGYRVLVARKPSEALKLAEEHAAEIALLITDVVMPEMNGRELADRLQTVYPAVKCLFMSGYTADVIALHGVLEEGVAFLQKPFSKMELAVEVRSVLDNN